MAECGAIIAIALFPFHPLVEYRGFVGSVDTTRLSYNELAWRWKESDQTVMLVVRNNRMID